MNWLEYCFIDINGFGYAMIDWNLLWSHIKTNTLSREWEFTFSREREFIVLKQWWMVTGTAEIGQTVQVGQSENLTFSNSSWDKKNANLIAKYLMRNPRINWSKSRKHFSWSTYLYVHEPRCSTNCHCHYNDRFLLNGNFLASAFRNVMHLLINLYYLTFWHQYIIYFRCCVVYRTMHWCILSYWRQKSNSSWWSVFNFKWPLVIS